VVLGFYHAPTTLFHQCLLDRYFRTERMNRTIDCSPQKDGTTSSTDPAFSLSIIHAIILTCGLCASLQHLWLPLFIASLAATLTSKAIDGCGTDPTTSQLHRARHFWFGCTVPAGRSFSFPSLFIHTLRCVLSLPRVPARFTLVPLSSSQLVAR